MNDKHNAYKRRVCVLAIAIACTILLLPFFTKVTIDVQYGQKYKGFFAQIYSDIGHGIREEDSISQKIKSAKCKFELSGNLSKLRDIRFDPVDRPTENEIVLKRISVSGRDGIAQTYSGESLRDIIAEQNDMQLVSCDENGICFRVTGDDAQLIFSETLIMDIRRAARQNFVIRGYLIMFFLVGVFLWVEQKELFRFVSMQGSGKIQFVLLIFLIGGIVFYLKREYGGKTGFGGQMLLLLAMLLGAFVCWWYQGQHTSKALSAEKIVSLLLLGQVMCGNDLLAKSGELTEDAVLFYGISILVHAVLWYFFWIQGKRSNWYLLFVAGIWLFRFSICLWGYGWNGKEAFLHTLDYIGTVPGMLSFLGFGALYCILWGILGSGMACVVYLICFILLFAGNMIEMVYHASFVKAIDVLSLGDLKAILHNYIGAASGVACVVFLLLLAGICIRNRSRIAAFLKPCRNSVALVSGFLVLIWLLTALDENVYMDSFGIRNDNNWSLEVRMEKKQGFFAFTYINLRRFLALIPQQPEEYSPQTIADTLADCLNTDEAEQIAWSEQPDVIFLMLESVIDPDMLTEAYGVTFSEDPDPTLDQYGLTTPLAPTFGGYTAKSEFEALTGMSDSFLPAGAVAYSAYFSNQTDYVYSIVDVFRRNGYQTTAIHQNDRTFYNRDAAYRAMGFDQFIAKGDYQESEQDYNEDGYLRNSHLLPLITEQLEQTDRSQFIWGVTIEGHSPYDDKYAETDIDVSCDSLNEEQIKELENYIQCVKNTDALVGELITYLQGRERPALLVVFGDHLPRLQAWDVWGTAADADKYYATVCAAFTSQGSLSVEEEYLSMNYLAPLVVHAAGIKDEPFYNYLSRLQKELPVIRSWHMGQEDFGKLKPYEIMQYDMLFEKQIFHR